MDPKKQVIVFDKLSEKKQNEILLKQLSNDNITRDNIIGILDEIKIDQNLYDVLSDISIGDFITTKLSSDQKRILYNNFAIFLKDFDNISIKEKNKSIDSKESISTTNSIEGSGRDTVFTIDGKKYTVDDIVATEKNFTKFEKPSDEFEEARGANKNKIKKINYISGKAILDSAPIRELKDNRITIQKIFDLCGGVMGFLKKTELVEFDIDDKISKSELTSCRDSDGNWHSGGLGHYGFICLRALYSDGYPICIIAFGGDSAHLDGGHAKNAIRIAS